MTELSVLCHRGTQDDADSLTEIMTFLINFVFSSLPLFSLLPQHIFLHPSLHLTSSIPPSVLSFRHSFLFLLLLASPLASPLGSVWCLKTGTNVHIVLNVSVGHGPTNTELVNIFIVLYCI